MPKLADVGISSPTKRKKTVAAPKKTSRGVQKPVELVSPTTGEKFLVIPNTVLAWNDETDNVFVDVNVHAVFKKDLKATVSIANSSNARHYGYKPGEKFKVSFDTLDVRMNPGINQRFDYYESMVETTFKGGYPSLLVIGEGGLGKSHTYEMILEKLGYEREVNYEVFKGHISAVALFSKLAARPDGLFIFDDTDSIWADKSAENIIKGVLDTKKRRVVDWETKAGSKSFEFTGQIVFVSNYNRTQFSSAILSRTILIDLYMTPEEKIQRLRYILHNIDYEGDPIPRAKKEEILGILEKYRNSIYNLNARTLLKALKVYAKSGDLGQVKYQIFNS